MYLNEDPIDDGNWYYDRQALLVLEQWKAIDIMKERKNEAIKKIEKIVDPLYAELIGKIISYGFFEDNDESLALTNILNLEKEDLLAISDDSEYFYELCKKRV